YGRVIDLIDFDKSLAEAIDAAGGGRLSYFVVEDIDVAKKVIDALKKAKAGRATFIPIKDVKAPDIRRGNKPLIIDMISYNPSYDAVMRYVFSNTVLASDFEEAKQLRESSMSRIVTLKGELFESSGIVTGGRSRASVAMSKAAEDVSAAMSSLKNEKEAVLNELRDLKERIAELRMEKAKLSAKEEEAQKNKEKAERARQLAKEVAVLEKSLQEKKHLYEKAKEELATLSSREEETLAKRKELEKIVVEKTASLASKQARAQALAEQRVSLERDVKKISAKKSSLTEQLNNLNNKERALRDKKMILSSSIVQAEEQLKERYKEVQGIMDNIKVIDNSIQTIGMEKAELDKNKSSIEKSIHNVELSLATTKERLSIIMADAPQEEMEELEEPTPKLESEMTELTMKISSMGDINFAASEAYEKINSDVGDVKDKIEKLNAEKKAVLDMINEIDKQKREAFLDAFKTLNDKFKEMFTYLEGFGEGELLLKNAENPDNAELYIVVKQDGKEVYLDALAGGEKTLVSLFFLYALNAVRPSPFYVFDEVDAALDKLNCERMVNFLKN
ncbi:MAG: chromosome segregation protein SMC, partial [Bdellovibrio sp.]